MVVIPKPALSPALSCTLLPAGIVSPPLKVLLPLSVRRPLQLLVRAWAPLITPTSVRLPTPPTVVSAPRTIALVFVEAPAALLINAPLPLPVPLRVRSEEHTSEL